MATANICTTADQATCHRLPNDRAVRAQSLVRNAPAHGCLILLLRLERAGASHLNANLAHAEKASAARSNQGGDYRAVCTPGAGFGPPVCGARVREHRRRCARRRLERRPRRSRGGPGVLTGRPRSGGAGVSRGRRARRCRRAQPGVGRGTGQPARGCRPSPPPSGAASTATGRCDAPAEKRRLG